MARFKPSYAELAAELAHYKDHTYQLACTNNRLEQREVLIRKDLDALQQKFDDLVEKHSSLLDQHRVALKRTIIVQRTSGTPITKTLPLRPGGMSSASQGGVVKGRTTPRKPTPKAATPNTPPRMVSASESYGTPLRKARTPTSGPGRFNLTPNKRERERERKESARNTSLELRRMTHAGTGAPSTKPEKSVTQIHNDAVAKHGYFSPPYLHASPSWPDQKPVGSNEPLFVEED